MVDKRMVASEHIYIKNINGLCIIYKTTRAGATTSLTVMAILLKEPTLVIVPTNKIAKDTIGADVKALCNGRAKIVHIPANRECLLIQEKIDIWGELAELNTMLLPETDCIGNCGHNHYCPVAALLREHNVDIYTATVHKIIVMMIKYRSRKRTDNDMITDQMNKILGCKNIILDEVHLFGGLDLGSGFVFQVRTLGWDDKNRKYPLHKFYKLPETEYPSLHEVIRRFHNIVDNINTEVLINTILPDITSDNYAKCHTKRKFVNENILEVGFHDDELFTKTCGECEQLAKAPQEHGLKVSDINELTHFLNIVQTGNLSITAIRSGNSIQFMVNPDEKKLKMLLREFIQLVNDGTRRILLTSATIDNSALNYRALCSGEYQEIIFGDNGDPLNINAKTKILADTKRYGVIGDSSIGKQHKEICSKIKTITEMFGWQNCFVSTLNKQTATLLQKKLKEMDVKCHVTYYGADDTIGVACNARVGIMVGVAYKPSNSFDAISDCLYESKILNEVSMHTSTAQCWGRIKDPMGIEPSVIFALGVRLQECENVCTWGTDRKTVIYGRPDENENDYVEKLEVPLKGEITPEKIKFPVFSDGKKRKVEISIDKKISEIECIECKSFDEMLIEARMHMISSPIQYEGKREISKEISNLDFTFDTELRRTLLPRIINEPVTLETWLRINEREVTTASQINGRSKILWFYDLTNHEKFNLMEYLTMREYEFLIEKFEGKTCVRILLPEDTVQAVKRLGLGIRADANISAHFYPSKVSSGRTASSKGSQELIPTPYGSNPTKIIYAELKN